MGSDRPVAELQDQALRQAWVDGPELGDGAAALFGIEVAQIGHRQVQTTSIQIRIHSVSSTGGSERHHLRGASACGQIAS